ncbi:MAG: ATP-binding protein [Candidatus Micrarchaeia archaeon]
MKINVGEGVDLDAQLVMTGRGCVIGQSGSGKSFLLGVIAEELCKINLPFLVIDTEGEYHNLKNAFKAIWVSNSSDADISLDVDYSKLLSESLSGNVPIIFDISDVVDQSSYVYSILASLYDLEDKMHLPYLVIIEEADKFAPQVTHTKKNMIEEISVRGRKRGIGLMIATQRPANISKNVLSQCSYGFVGKLTIDNDISAIDILFSSRQLRDSIVRLSQGEFVPFGIGIDHPIKVKSRVLSHYGSTPKVVAGLSSADISAIISRVSVGKEVRPINPNVQTQKKKRVPNIEETEGSISIIRPLYSDEDAIAYSKKMSSRHIIPITNLRPTETVESIRTLYYPLRHFRILIPRRNSHEFRERHALIDPMARIANVESKLKFIRQDVRVGAHISLSQEKLLERLRLFGKISIEKLEKQSESKTIHNDIKALAAIGAIKLTGKNIILNNGIRFASKRDFETVEVKGVPKEDIITMNDKSISATSRIMFPGCKVFDMGRLYIKMYKVTLRKKDRVRVFVMDSVSFKDRPELVNIVVDER